MRGFAIALTLMALSVFAISAPALDLEITGTFTMESVSGTPGADLLAILGNENSWSLVLQDVQFICDEWGCLFPPATSKRVQLVATSSSFQFAGPDAALLNAEVGQHFTQGGIAPHSAFLEVDGGGCDPVQSVFFYIWPDVTEDGVYMQVNAYAPLGTFPSDLDGCPIIESFTLPASAVLFDRRGSNDGNIGGSSNCTISIEAPVSVQESSFGRIKAIYK